MKRNAENSLAILQVYDKANTTNSTRCSHEMVSIFSKCPHIYELVDMDDLWKISAIADNI